jgi:hypothetical protein
MPKDPVPAWRSCDGSESSASVRTEPDRWQTGFRQVRYSGIAQRHGSWLVSLPCSIHLRIYDGQFLSLIPRASLAARKRIASRSTSFTSVKSSVTFVAFASASSSSCNSDTCLSSIRPLRAKAACPFSSDLRILSIAPQYHAIGWPHAKPSSNAASLFNQFTKFGTPTKFGT